MIVLIGVLSFPNRVGLYPNVNVPASAIRVREVPFTTPGPWDIGTKIRYVYVSPEIRAIAPASVKVDVERFCRPVTIPRQSDSEADVPSPSLIRTFAYNPSLVPLRKDGLLVTSMTGYGDLVAEDFRVRAPFGVAAGLEPPYHTIVRYPRLAPLREVATGVLWYGAFRLVEAVVR